VRNVGYRFVPDIGPRAHDETHADA
jgi:hypothetical protein